MLCHIIIPLPAIALGSTVLLGQVDHIQMAVIGVALAEILVMTR
jgi:hypothetical protein